MSIEQLDARIDLELHHDFISDEECAQLLDIAHSRGFKASSVVTPEGFQSSSRQNVNKLCICQRRNGSSQIS